MSATEYILLLDIAIKVGLCVWLLWDVIKEGKRMKTKCAEWRGVQE